MRKLPWSERVTMLSINPEAATIEDIAQMAADLTEMKMERFQTMELIDHIKGLLDIEIRRLNPTPKGE